ncbi:DUF2851 family protein [Aquimarina brevivitae]|uniref:Uncharacterized protein DUF2851 n=1 Tax=Aquimarina brevivitae TaxID=323412 RepID=A0A4V2F5J9_9FLAO|nr:DUF2851 family protein [Aquimarina brevivitae]RZS93079.1 uncharacterized protein DUF2851 [Aquimarina brevivitae]
MKEDFLHHIWKYKKYNGLNLATVNGASIAVLDSGTHNESNGGPDFFNALLCIDDQKWAGNVEIHVKSSDWYLHNHQNDDLYNNVILHVVWEDDVEVYNKDNSPIPTLRIKDFVDTNFFANYQKLSNSKNSLNCQGQLQDIPGIIQNNWLERLYFERLEKKATEIEQVLKSTKNDWEAVLFHMLCRSFGLNTNGEAFYSLAQSIDFSVLRKCTDQQQRLEALLLGQAGLLEDSLDHEYANTLQEEYHYLKTKFSLDNTKVLPVNFFRLRPSNFPTVRLVQLAALYATKPSLFSAVTKAKSLLELMNLLDVKPNSFWETHYSLTKTSKKKSKRLSKSFKELLIINTLLPIRFAYQKYTNEAAEDKAVALITSLSAEDNAIVKRFKKEKITIKNAMESQAVIQLFTKYCSNNRCLQCGFGNYLLKN